MRKIRKPGIPVLAIASCAALALGALPGSIVPGGALASQPMTGGATDGDATGVAVAAPTAAPQMQLASRDMAERYYQVYRLVGSAVLNLDGERIGRVDTLILNDQGEIQQMLVKLGDTPDVDGGAIAISPHRAEIVSTNGSKVTVIRVDLSREELIQAQLARLKLNARAPAQRGAGQPALHRIFGPLY